QHREMKSDNKTFQRLLKITELFPEYFVASNADLAIVGGSILSHDHYEAGRHTFPMHLAPMEKRFSLKKYPQITEGI
ncbi:UDP-glucose--hexose-1-phosphate uridylyltransferase, partial [Enterococcus faecalis]